MDEIDEEKIRADERKKIERERKEERTFYFNDGIKYGKRELLLDELGAEYTKCKLMGKDEKSNIFWSDFGMMVFKVMKNSERREVNEQHRP